MRSFITYGLLLGLISGVARSDDTSKQADAKKDKDTYDSLTKEIISARQKWMADWQKESKAKAEALAKALDEAKTDEEKQAVRKKLQNAMSMEGMVAVGQPFAKRYLEFAKQNPKDEAAPKALVWAIELSQSAGDKSGVAKEALQILEKDYLPTPAIKPAVPDLAGSLDPAAAKLLEQIMEKNPDRKTQAQACKALVQNQQRAVRAAYAMKKNEQVQQMIEMQLGQERAQKFASAVDAYKAKAESMGNVLKSRYGDIIPDISVGKPVPEVEAVDAAGKPVKLSSLRGKVTMLDIWATWCGPCRAMIPHSRETVEKLKDKPFALVSLSADDDRKTLVEFLKNEKMPWHQWWIGTQGLVEDWDIEGFPTIVLVDSEGIIREKWVGTPGEKKIDEAIEKLLKDAAKKSVK